MTQLELNKLYSLHTKAENKLSVKTQQLKRFSLNSPEYKRVLSKIIEAANEIQQISDQIERAKK